MNSEQFFEAFDTLVLSSEIVLDRPKGSLHPRYPGIRYPLDYGYLRGTQSGDGDGIDMWIDSMTERRVTGVVLCVDLVKRDSECKVLYACTREEMQQVLAFHQQGMQSALLVVRTYHSRKEMCVEIVLYGSMIDEEEGIDNI